MKGGFLCIARQRGIAACKQEHSTRRHIDRHQDMARDCANLWLAGLKLPLQRRHHLFDLRLGEAPVSHEEVLDDTTGVAALQGGLIDCKPVAGKIPRPVMAVDTLALIEGAAGDVPPEGFDQGFDLGLGRLLSCAPCLRTRARYARGQGWQAPGKEIRQGPAIHTLLVQPVRIDRLRPRCDNAAAACR
jgi:hypothetical protein